MKKRYKILTTIICVSCLVACGKLVPDNDILEERPTERNSIIETEAQDIQITETDNELINKAYISVLENVYFKHILPGDIELDYNDNTDLSQNNFAIYDIDQDGRDELIIVYSTACMAGMLEIIYDFDISMNAVYEEFFEFPNNIFYNNGVIEADWSHNQGYAGDFWPYTLYQYDKNSDTYVVVAYVDAWDKSISEKDHQGNHFPEDIDVNGDGIVYYVTPKLESKTDNMVDLEEYNKWRDSYTGGAEEVKIPFVDLTEENIYTIK